jgi:iron complex outermembrane receptor protein
MQRAKLFARLLATTAILSGVSTVAAAQETIGEVIVTARRTEERLQDVPISITVFNQEQLSRQNVTTVADLAKYTPSLSSSERFGPERASFAIRGFNQEAQTSPSVAVYFADVIAPRNLSFVAGGNGAGPGSFFDLENAQVLKGPQGTLFGRNTTGGAILLVPRKPTDQFEGYVEGSIGNYDMRRLQAVVNLPVNDMAKLRIGVDQMRREGYLDNHSGIGPKHFSDVDYVAVRASLLLDFAPNFENYSILSYSNSDTSGALVHMVACQPNPLLRASLGVFVGDAACVQFGRQTARGDSLLDVENSHPAPQDMTRTWQLINTTTWRVNDKLTVRNIASYSTYKNIWRGISSGENLVFPPVLNLASGGVVRPVPTGALAGTPFYFIATQPYLPVSHWSTQQWTLTEELQFRGEVGNLTWQAGGYAEKSEPMAPQAQVSATLLSCSDVLTGVCTDTFSAFGGGGPLGSYAARIANFSFRDYGLYAQGTYKLTDKLSATAGIRYTWDRHTAQGAQMAIQFPPARGAPRQICSNTLRVPGPIVNGVVTQRVAGSIYDCLITFEAKSDKPTWVIDLEYKPVTDVMIYGKYSRGYRQGLANPFAAGFEILAPESVDSYELGAKTRFGGPAPGVFNIIAFYNDLKNQQIAANALARPGTGVNSSQTVANLGKSEMKGVEIDASIQPFEGMTLSVGYAYLDTELKTISLPDLSTNPIFVGLQVGAAIGEALPMSPKNRVTVGANYVLPLSDELGEISVGANFTHTDKQVATYSSIYGRLKATDLLDLNATWKNIMGAPVDLALFATNVTNRIYANYASGSLGSAGMDNVNQGAPRMYGMRLRYRFGQQ